MIVKRFFGGLKIKYNNIIMFGAPGSGKGTYGSMLKNDLDYKVISTGDAIRNILKDENNKSEEAESLREIIKNGELVNDDLIIKLTLSLFNSNKEAKGFIFDGVPRNISQYNIMRKTFNFQQSLIINCELNEDILIEKLLGRRICKGCGKNYNICTINKNGYEMEPLLPKVENKCDKCGDILIKREDDKVDIIKHRLEVYHHDTEPILKEFKKSEIKIINFEPKRGVKDYPNLLDLIN